MTLLQLVLILGALVSGVFAFLHRSVALALLAVVFIVLLFTVGGMTA